MPSDWYSGFVSVGATKKLHVRLVLVSVGVRPDGAYADIVAVAAVRLRRSRD